MKFQITKIDFDVQNDDFDDIEEERKLNENLQNVYVGQIWDCDDEEDLVDEITCASGFCVKSVDYRHILK